MLNSRRVAYESLEESEDERRQEMDDMGIIQNSLKMNPRALWSYVEFQKGSLRISGRMCGHMLNSRRVAYESLEECAMVIENWIVRGI
ncbi:hypothetical protein QE152_g19638 [Popillia japonica]|uniref:Uncharacterized protein n=1 Tax=Popillia japonica TaxID=7064 RepID=A0AAW1KR59_POPJA